MQFIPTLCLTDVSQGRIPQLSVGGGRIMERRARSEGKVLENCGTLLHDEEALLSLVMLILRLIERRDEEGIRALGDGRSNIDHCALYRV